jgi:hypothetical protein
MSIFPLVAFVVASCVYTLMSLKALRMKPVQTARFENLPFDSSETVSHEK